MSLLTMHANVCPECGEPDTQHPMDPPNFCTHEYERRVPVRFVACDLEDREELIEKAAAEDVWMYRAANGMRLERSRQEVIDATSLFDDPRVIAAGAQIVHEIYCDDCHTCNGPVEDDGEQARVVLSAALAALPREELVEKAARAIYERHAGARWLEWHPWEGDPPGEPHSAMAERQRAREKACAAFVAIGLIPEHVTATEEPK